MLVVFLISQVAANFAANFPGMEIGDSLVGTACPHLREACQLFDIACLNSYVPPANDTHCTWVLSKVGGNHGPELISTMFREACPSLETTCPTPTENRMQLIKSFAECLKTYLPPPQDVHCGWLLSVKPQFPLLPMPARFGVQPGMEFAPSRGFPDMDRHMSGNMDRHTHGHMHGPGPDGMKMVHQLISAACPTLESICPHPPLPPMDMMAMFQHKLCVDSFTPPEDQVHCAWMLGEMKKIREAKEPMMFHHLQMRKWNDKEDDDESRRKSHKKNKKHNEKHKKHRSHEDGHEERWHHDKHSQRWSGRPEGGESRSRGFDMPNHMTFPLFADPMTKRMRGIGNDLGLDIDQPEVRSAGRTGSFGVYQPSDARPLVSESP